MKILIINIDSKIPNLALKKIEKYHKDKGDEVITDYPLAQNSVDKIYVSCIFSWNKNKAEQWENKAEIGGSGYDLVKTLPKEIDEVKPKINLGYTTIGCIRKCAFCIVWKKEPIFKRVATILDLWNGDRYFINKKGKKERTIVTFLDNNALADFEWFKMNCEIAQKNNLKVDYNQGLDHRLLNQDICDILKATSHVEYRFAFDHPSNKPTVEKTIALLKKNKINRCQWYVLVGFNTTVQEDLDRLNFLRDNGQNAYVQRYNFTHDRKYIPIARWANQRHLFQALTFEKFLKKADEEVGGRYKNEFKTMYADVLK